MTEAQQRFIDLDKKKAAYKEYMEEYQSAINSLQEEMGTSGHFQDAEGIVYQVEECLGKFTHFYKYEVKRTKREGERAGSLAMTKARDLGYSV